MARLPDRYHVSLNTFQRNLIAAAIGDAYASKFEIEIWDVHSYNGYIDETNRHDLALAILCLPLETVNALHAEEDDLIAFETKEEERFMLVTMIEGLKRDEEEYPGCLHGLCLYGLCL